MAEVPKSTRAGNRERGAAITCFKSSELPVRTGAIVDCALSPDFPLGVEFEVFICREDAERFVEEVRVDDRELAAKLRIEERALEAGCARNQPAGR